MLNTVNEMPKKSITSFPTDHYRVNYIVAEI